MMRRVSMRNVSATSGDAVTLVFSLRDLLRCFDLFEMESESAHQEHLNLNLGLDQIEPKLT
jgi:hypothetical protein